MTRFKRVIAQVLEEVPFCTQGAGCRKADPDGPCCGETFLQPVEEYEVSFGEISTSDPKPLLCFSCDEKIEEPRVRLGATKCASCA